MASNDGKRVETARRGLLKQIDRDMRATARWTGRSALSPAVRSAIAGVPREAFVRPVDRLAAYENRPLAIGHGQTISQPYIVALMTELLDPIPADVVLEVGSGCGYQTAVLAELVEYVYGVEIVAELAAEASERLRSLGYVNVDIVLGDGSVGRVEHAPFDKILVTAAAASVPPALVEQLASGGRMVLPVGLPRREQQLVLVTRSDRGRVEERSLLPVAFVPLISRDQ